MSNALAIAAVTTTLRAMLDTALALAFGGVDVTTLPPDKARTTTHDQINIFLYNTSIDAALRNTPPPTSKPGETGESSLPLRLQYLFIAYGQGDDDALGHRLLGEVMSVLHDHPLLSRDEIRDATSGPLPDSDLHTQVERVRITPMSLNLEEMSKLWMTFQTQFRISAAYEISVVLIDSKRPTLAALPVLGRGSQDDAGVEAAANVESPFPSLSSVESPDPAALLPGETLTLRGANLSGTNVSVRIKHQLMDADRVLAPLPGATATEVRVVVPNEPANLPAGIYTVAVEVVTTEAAHPGVTFTRTTNRLAFARAPVITSAMPATFARNGAGHVSIPALTCNPQVQPGQRASLLLGGREIHAQPFTTATATLDFEFDNPTPAESPAAVESFARLRVDGVDSLLMDRTVTPPVFRNGQKVTIT
jgi:hypothetical protein